MPLLLPCPQSALLRKQVLFIGQNKIVSELYQILWAPQYMWGELIFRIWASLVVGNIPGGQKREIKKLAL